VTLSPLHGEMRFEGLEYFVEKWIEKKGESLGAFPTFWVSLDVTRGSSWKRDTGEAIVT